MCTLHRTLSSLQKWLGLACVHTSPDPFAEVARSSLWDQDRDYEQEPQDYWLGLPHVSAFFQPDVTRHYHTKEKFRCYEAQIEESEKAGSRRESNPGHLARVLSITCTILDELSQVLSHHTCISFGNQILEVWKLGHIQTFRGYMAQ